MIIKDQLRNPFSGHWKTDETYSYSLADGRVLIRQGLSRRIGELNNTHYVGLPRGLNRIRKDQNTGQAVISVEDLTCHNRQTLIHIGNGVIDIPDGQSIILTDGLNPPQRRLVIRNT